MENMGNKKIALLYILDILRQESDADHPLTQNDIADKLVRYHGIVLERKAVSRNLSLLREAGYEVESTAKGVYLDLREFDNTELRLMIDGVLSSRYITEKQAKDLANRIAGLSNKHFRSHVKHIHTLSQREKTENNTVFYTVELIDEAIEAGLQVSFDYYSIDENLKFNKKWRVTVSPIQMVVKNQYYYLLACETQKILGRAGADRGGGGAYPVIVSYRMDLMSNPLIEDTKAQVDIATLRKHGEEPNPADFLRTHPYMHSHAFPSRDASFLCYQNDLKMVVENLGTDIRVQKVPPKPEKTTDQTAKQMLKISVKIDLNELVEFACRYPQRIFLLSPAAAVKRQKELYEAHNKMMETIAHMDV